MTTQRELLNTQTHVSDLDKEHSSTKPLIEREQIHGTPFWLITHNNECTIVMGKYKINEEPLKDMQEARIYLANNRWNITAKMIAIITTDIKEQQ